MSTMQISKSTISHTLVELINTSLTHTTNEDVP